MSVDLHEQDLGQANVDWLKSARDREACARVLDVATDEQAYSPSEPRDSHGRWTSGGGGGELAEISDKLAEGEHVEVPRKEIEPLLERLSAEGKPVNLAKAHVTGEPNCFDHPLRQITRENMPQLPTSAAELRGFVSRLKAEGIKFSVETVDPRTLKMTQNQLNGAKVGKIFEGIRERGWDNHNITICSRENAILDGHHRWAAATAVAICCRDIGMRVLRVNTDIDNLLRIARDFSHKRAPLAAAQSPDNPPDPDKPWIFIDGDWYLVTTDTSDGVPERLEFPEPTEQAYSPSEPRDSHGRWSTTGTPMGLPAMGSTVEGELVRATRRSGGFTYHAVQGISPVGGGYMVSPYAERGRVIDGKRFGKQHLADFARDNRDLLRKPDHFLGAWTSEGKVYLDVSVRVMDQRAAVRLAHEHDQLAIWDLKNGAEIDTRGEEREAAGYLDRPVRAGDGRWSGSGIRGDPGAARGAGGTGSDRLTVYRAFGSDGLNGRPWSELVGVEFRDRQARIAARTAAEVRTIGTVAEIRVPAELATVRDDGVLLRAELTYRIEAVRDDGVVELSADADLE